MCRSTYQKSYMTLSLNAGWISDLFKKIHSFLLQFEHFNTEDWASAHWSIMELQFFTNLMPTLFFSPGRCCLVEAEKRNHSVDLLFFKIIRLLPWEIVLACCSRTFSTNTSLRLNEPVWRISSTYWKHFVTPLSSSVSNIWTLYRNSSAVWQVLWKRKLTICRYKALNASQQNYHSCFTYNEITCFDNPPFCFSLYG